MHVLIIWSQFHFYCLFNCWRFIDSGWRNQLSTLRRLTLWAYIQTIWIDVAIFWIVRNFYWTYYLYFKSVIEPKRSFIYSTNQGGISSDVNYANQNIKCVNLSGSEKIDACEWNMQTQKTRIRILACKH